MTCMDDPHRPLKSAINGDRMDIPCWWLVPRCLLGSPLLGAGRVRLGCLAQTPASWGPSIMVWFCVCVYMYAHVCVYSIVRVPCGSSLLTVSCPWMIFFSLRQLPLFCCFHSWIKLSYHILSYLILLISNRFKQSISVEYQHHIWGFSKALL